MPLVVPKCKVDNCDRDSVIGIYVAPAVNAKPVCRSHADEIEARLKASGIAFREVDVARKTYRRAAVTK